MSSGNDWDRKKKKIEKLSLAKISRKLKDKPTFHVGGSYSQAVFPNHPQQEILSQPTVNMVVYPPSVSAYATTNILVLLFSYQIPAKGPYLSWRAYPALLGMTLLRYISIISTNFGLSTLLPMTWGVLKIVI